jgi:hypothetical protein
MSEDSRPILAYFEQYEWAAEELEPGVWRSTFSSENDEEFDLYVMVAEEWIHFAVSPFVALGDGLTRPHLLSALLRLNQRMRLVRLGVDDQGDLNLVADVPLARFSFGDFALIVDLLVEYAGALHREIARSVANENYFSPLLPTP